MKDDMDEKGGEAGETATPSVEVAIHRMADDGCPHVPDDEADDDPVPAEYGGEA